MSLGSQILRISPHSNTRAKYGHMSVGSKRPWRCPRTDIPTFKYMDTVWSHVRVVPKSSVLPQDILGYPHLKYKDTDSVIPRPCGPKVLCIVPGHPRISPPQIQGHSIFPCPWGPNVLGIAPGHPSIYHTRTRYCPMSVGSQSPRYCPRTSQDIPTSNTRTPWGPKVLPQDISTYTSMGIGIHN